MKLTKEQAALIREYLALQFTWLADDDDESDLSGGDVVMQLGEIYDSLEAV